MGVIDTLLTDIESAVRGTGERRRHALLRRTAATLVDQAHDLSDHQLSVFDDVMVSLALDVETETRAELAEKLADLVRAPKKTIRALAHDPSIRVAKPVIERSPCLDDDMLMALVSEKNSAVLNLVAKRRALPAVIMDHLVTHADDALLVDIARNDSAFLSDLALQHLAERALTYQPLYRILRTRPDLATRHIGALIEAARYRTKTDSMMHDSDDDMLSHALAIETAHSISQSAQISLSTGSVSATLSELDGTKLEDLLAHDKVDDALALLALQAGISTDAVKRAFHAPQHEPLMFLLRAQDYPVSVAMNFMRLKHGGLSALFEQDLNHAYCALARDTAKRIAAFMTEKQNASTPDADMPEPLRHSA